MVIKTGFTFRHRHYYWYFSQGLDLCCNILTELLGIGVNWYRFYNSTHRSHRKRKILNQIMNNSNLLIVVIANYLCDTTIVIQANINTFITTIVANPSITITTKTWPLVTTSVPKSPKCYPSLCYLYIVCFIYFFHVSEWRRSHDAYMNILATGQNIHTYIVTGS